MCHVCNGWVTVGCRLPSIADFTYIRCKLSNIWYTVVHNLLRVKSLFYLKSMNFPQSRWPTHVYVNWLSKRDQTYINEHAAKQTALLKCVLVTCYILQMTWICSAIIYSSYIYKGNYWYLDVPYVISLTYL